MQLTMTDYRKKLIPKWIKFFGWLFLIMGAAVFIVPIFWVFNKESMHFMLFGLEHYGSPFEPTALLISALLLFNSIAAYGLLFAKDWGVKVCMAAGWVVLGICVLTMAYGLFALNELYIRLELIVLIPYLLKLREIAPRWMSVANGHDQALTQA